MQVAAYARVSTQRQVQAQTTEQQLDRLRAHAAAQGWALAPEHVFRDDGHSGASLRRPGLDRLRDAAAAARVDRVLITAPDRLARNYVHQVLLVEELQKHGAVVDFLDRPMSRDPHDQLLLRIRGAVADPGTIAGVAGPLPAAHDPCARLAPRRVRSRACRVPPPPESISFPGTFRHSVCDHGWTHELHL